MKKFLVLFTAVFFSCTTLQQGDIFVNSHRDQMERDLSKLEEIIVPLEAAGGAEVRGRQSDMTATVASARRMIVELEKEAAADADYSGRLLAWSGRLAILEGRYSEAQRLYRQSIAVSSGNIPSIILGIRLEGDPAKRLELIERELALTGLALTGSARTGQHSAAGFGELQIERGRSLLETQRFTEAAGAFDAAFSSGLNNVYRESYQKDRDRAWELRNSGGASAGTLDMLRDTVNWSDCIAIAKNETQLLRFLSGGRNVTDAELFNRLLERAFIPYTQDISVSEWPRTRPRADETVTRSGAAWFVWHLYAEARGDRGLLSRYSSRYATGSNPRSPITDIPPLSPFFDSILGCVETELLYLPDGRNFRPSQPIRGAELLSILRKIDN
jgi:tetratricopeptide (TPR) repeat protein